jgi:hypothetical protein
LSQHLSLLGRPRSFVIVSLLAAFSATGCVSAQPGDDDVAGTGGTGPGGAGGAPGGGAGATGGSGGMGTGGSTGGTAGTSSPPVGGAGGASGGTGGAGATAGTGGVAGSVAATGGSAGVPGGAAGQVGSGGMGLGGSAGGPPLGGSGGDAGAAAGTGGSGGSKATGFFMDDFEAGTTGKQPGGWDNLIAYNKNGSNPSGTTLALVDTMHVHGGTQAVHFHGDSNPAQLVKALDTGMTKLYIRVWVYMTRKLGQQTDMSANHETLIALRRVSGGVNDEVRFGEIKGVVGVNEVPSDNISPTMDKWHQATGPLIPADAWACLEVAFLADSSPNTLHAWTGGTLLQEVTSVGTDAWQNGSMPADWLAKKFGGTPSEIVIGWQSFSNAANDVWMDDLILSTSPIGCD